MYYINNFYLYSILGFIYENFICILLNNNMESGFMYGPFTPIYGIGILVIIIIYNNTKNIKNNFIRNLLIFIFSVIILTIMEYVGGILINLIFNKDYWNYSYLPLHINKYISLEISFIWGIASLIYVNILKRITDKIVLMIPKYITYIVSIVFILDLVLTLFNNQKIF